ncbi:ribonuclease H-like domain-containing protein [Tanacetum coccineum]
MRTKPGVYTLSFDDLYNNLRVFESDIKGSTISSSSTRNVAFVSSESTNSTNDVSTAYGVSTSSGHNSQKEGPSSYTDELKYSFFANQSSGLKLDHEDLKQVDEFDLEEMDLKWQVAMISMRLKKFYKKTGKRLQFNAKEPVGFDKTKVKCFNCHNIGHLSREFRSKENQESRRRDAGNTGYKAKDNGRRPGKQEEPKALVTLDGEGVDWTGHAEDEQDNFSLMAYSNSGSNTEVTSCSKECVESYAKLTKLYDEQREKLGDASIEIQAYNQALKKVEAQLVSHQKNQLWYEEKIRFMKIDLDDKTDVLTYHKKLLAEAVKEKEELKTKLENFQSSSKGLSKLLNSQMSTRDKSGLGSSDVEDSPVYDRFAKVKGMHAVPPTMTGNYMPPKSDFGIDESNFTYGPKQSKTSESNAKTSDFDSCKTNSSVEILESLPEPVVVKPKVVSQPKFWSDAPIIEEYESDSDDEYVIKPSKEQEKPTFSFVNTVKHVKTHRETVKEQNICSPSPKVNKRDWNGSMSKRLGLGYGFTKKACFVCGSFSHLIRDCDFHEKRMAKQVELNKKKGKGTGQGENRPVWNNVQRLNHQNKFVPKAVLTKTGIFSVNTARQNPFSQAAETSTARKVNTARPIVNEIRPRNTFYKSHSPIRRPFNKSTAPKANFTNHKVNTAGDKIVSAVRGYRETAVKASAGCNWRPKRHYWTKVSKYNSGSNSNKNDDPQKALKNKGIVDSGCSRHMTGNKAYLVEYQDYNGGPVAFGGSKGYISGKGKIKTRKLDFEDVCFVKELQHFNLFSVSQMCDKKNKVLFTDTGLYCVVPDFKFALMKIKYYVESPDKNNYVQSFQLRELCLCWQVLACLIAKATVDESNKWHRRCDNGTEFKNRDIIELCGSKGIKREYSNARTPQQNGVAERKNKTLIEAARTMLADSFLPNTFWAEAVSTACYVLNRVLVTKPQNKTPYELITGKIPIISYIRPFGCHVTILNTIDHLGKFEEKSNEGFLVGYSLNSKAFRVYNLETKRVEDNLHINFLENKPNVAGKGPNWLFDLDYLIDSMNYQPVTAENKANKTAGLKEANHSADGLLYSNSQEAQSQYGDIEPKKISQALEDESWVDAMQEELFASNYGTIDEEVYVSQPLGFVDPKFPKKVEQVGKSSLYGLHQAPRAWYATLSTFLLRSGYRRGTINKTIFIKKDKNDIMLILDEFYGRAHLSFLDKVKQKEDGIFISQVQVLLTSKSSHLHAVKKVFSKILTGKSTTGGCQISAGDLFYGSCKKQTNLWILLPQRQSSCRLQMLWASIGDSESNVFRLWTKLSTARPKLSTDSTKIESMKLEAMVEERRIFKCWFHYHTTNGHQFTMSNRHQELASPEQTASGKDFSNSKELASPKQTALGKDISNPLIVDSLLKTIWLPMHHVIAMKHLLFQSKRLLGRIVGFQKFLKLVLLLIQVTTASST